MKKKSGFAKIVVSVILLLIIGMSVYLYNSDDFEQQPPEILIERSIYWNLKSPYQFSVKDSSGIKSLNVYLKTQNGKTALPVGIQNSNKTEFSALISPPKGMLGAKSEKYTLEIEAVDNSRWNFFNGNKSTLVVEITTDTHPPMLQVVSSSYSITKGGSALVIFKATDEALNELYVEDDKYRFIPQPFYKDGYYASLIAWSVTKEGGFSPKIVATDKAGNKSVLSIKYFLKSRNYKTSKITIKDEFLDGKINELITEAGVNREFAEKIEKFRHINEDMRIANEELIYKESSKIDKTKIVERMEIEPFYPLKNGAAVASFGDRRFFEYQGKQISDSWHLGLDLASTQNAEIKSSNAATVVYADYNGIYGNMLILEHGFGLYTLYGHCSGFAARKGETVQKEQVIARSGKSGLALGDHLHFGVLVQGIEVRPEEWMDKQWMKLNITDVMDTAKKAIEGK